MKWNWQMRFSSPRGSIADSPKDNQRKRKKERNKNGTGRSVLLHLVVVLETALKSPVHSATLNLRHFHLECPVFWGAENTWYS